MACFSEEVLNADLRITLSLMEEQSLRLKQSLKEESIRYAQLQRYLSAFVENNNVDSIFTRDKGELDARIKMATLNLRRSLSSHCQKCVSLNTEIILSANTFAAEYLKQDLYERFTSLQQDYAAYLNDWEHLYEEELLIAFEKFVGFLPAHHRPLRDRIDKLTAYYRLDEECPNILIEHYLPATDRTIEILIPIGIRHLQGDISSISAKWKLAFYVLKDGILGQDESSKGLPLSEYIRINIGDSILEDYKADISRIISNRVVNGIIAKLNVICIDATRQLDDALAIMTE